jgi:predicted N-acetyltransferase YhbS
VSLPLMLSRGRCNSCGVVGLDYIAVHPDFQGRGIGSMLVRAGLEAAEKNEWDVFVFSNTPDGRKLYTRSGFTMLEQVLQDTKKFHGTHVYELTFFEKRLIKEEQK